MSFTLTYKDLANQNFLTGIKKVVLHDKWKDPKRLYNAARIGGLLQNEFKIYDELQARFFKKVMSLQPANPQELTPADEENKRMLQEEKEKFPEISFVIERHKVDFEDLASAGLTPNEVLALEPLLDNLPE